MLRQIQLLIKIMYSIIWPFDFFFVRSAIIAANIQLDKRKGVTTLLQYCMKDYFNEGLIGFVYEREREIGLFSDIVCMMVGMAI